MGRVLYLKYFLFKHQALRRIFEPKKTKITGGWEKLSSEELRKLHFSHFIRMVDTDGIVEGMREFIISIRRGKQVFGIQNRNP